MKENSVFFPLTNPSQRLDKGRRLAGVGTRLSKSQNNSSFGLNQAFIWGMSAKWGAIGFQNRPRPISFQIQPASWRRPCLVRHSQCSVSVLGGR
ncbi:MAG: hypothetical protein O9296_09440 [Novosphingobium sp.]|nr:hypothetical protein [Novosphingobium sp.]